MEIEETRARQRWMSILAKATPGELNDVWARLPQTPQWNCLRRPETGLVMLRGRTGGEGAPFNLGEMTVTRCSVQLTDGAIGHAYVAGRDRRHAERAAVLDALLQDRDRREQIDAAVLAPLAALQRQRSETAARKSAATRVDFFTLVRGED